MKKAFAFIGIMVVFAFSVLTYLYLNTKKTTSNINIKNNFVVIVSDALRADMLGCYGSTLKTPNIDWLASQGTLFERAYSTSPWTTPSAVSMITGCYPDIYRNGVVSTPIGILNAYQLSDDPSALGNIIKNKGYRVLADIENLMARLPKANIWQGFKKKQYPLKQKFFDVVWTVKFLRNQDTKQPFFIFKWILDPHSPYCPPDSSIQKISVDVSKLQHPPDYYSSKSFGTLMVSKWNQHEHNYLKKLYEKEVESVDERIGTIIKTLKRKNIFNKTFIIFTADHGELFGEHGQWVHGRNFYEQLVHVPLIVVGPGIPKGKRINNIVSLIDLSPTILDLLKINDERQKIQGSSFADLLRSNNSQTDNWAYCVELTKDELKQRDALIENDFKLITHQNGGTELYHLTDDPSESNDLSGNHPEIVNRMFDKIQTIRNKNMELMKGIKKQTSPVKLDKDALDQLKALGYVK